MKKNDITNFIKILKEAYPDATCSLDFETPFQIVVAVMLSAQCTDELEEVIHPCGFYRNKAKNIKLCAKQVLEKFNGEVPKTMDELLTLAGVGRKSANVILLEAFGIANGIAVDTHVKRVSNRIGLSHEKGPEKIEQDLLKIFPKDSLKDINHLFIWHGRKTCDSRKPLCENCSVKNFCEYYKKNCT